MQGPEIDDFAAWHMKNQGPEIDDFAANSMKC